jgi:hypothetical protein
MNRSARRAAIAALPLVAAGLLSGCAGSGTPPVSTGATAAPTAGTTVPAAVLAARVRAAVRTAGTVQFRVRDRDVVGSGAFDLRHGDLRAAMTLKDGRKNIRAVVLPQVTFLNVGQPIYGRHWLRVEQPVHHAAFKTMRAAFVTLLAATSPTNQTRAWALGAPFRAGQTANLGSEAATEFDSTMSESALESVVPAAALKAVKPVGGTAKGSDTATLKVWLNERSLPLKIELIPPPGDDSGITTITYVNWHVTAAVKAPPSRDVLTGKF